MATIGLLHPGEMGAAIGGLLVDRGHHVAWASDGRGPSTRDRARAAGLVDVGSVERLTRNSAVILSVCPPHAALDVARQVAEARFAGVYVDANAISPRTAAEVGSMVGAAGATWVDGGIIGLPPGPGGGTRLYLSGDAAGEVVALFAGTPLEAVALTEGGPTGASALKMAYAAWTKGSAALLLGARAAAHAYGVEDALVQEWQLSQPELEARVRFAAGSASAKGWRWIAEMEEIAATLAAAGLPDGFHLAAADVFRRIPREPAPGDPDATVDRVLQALHQAADRS
jgi:3-hydroxyisobutyrate dehydrogenase-like beta-hydroxyacid dehydrogenase